MGLKFRKSFKIAPGVRVNVGTKSAGVSFGGKYGGVSFNSRTGARARVSAPGTGLSHSTRIGNRSSRQNTGSASSGLELEEVNAKTYFFLAIFLGWIGVHRFYRKQVGLGILYLFTLGLFCVGWIVDIVIASKNMLTNRNR